MFSTSVCCSDSENLNYVDWLVAFFLSEPLGFYLDCSSMLPVTFSNGIFKVRKKYD